MPRNVLEKRTINIILATGLALFAGMPIAFGQQPADTLPVPVIVDARTGPLLSEAETLLVAGLSQQAYDLLLPHEAGLAGHPLFDYLLGVAALDSGHHSEAIFSLRRSLSVTPEFSGARMELARAYYESGNKDLARVLFVRLVDDNPPTPVLDVIEQYIAAIDRRPAEPRRRFTPFLESAFGYDSNANASTDNQDFLGFMLSPDNQEVDSSFIDLGAGFHWINARSPSLQWNARLRAGHRFNPDATFMDATNLGGQVGVSWQRGMFFGHAGVDAFWGAREGHYNEKYGGLALTLGRRFGEYWDLSTNLRYGGQRYVDSINVLDVNRALYSLGLRRHFPSLAWFGFYLAGGQDVERQNGSPSGNSRFGVRVAAGLPLSSGGQLFASVGHMRSDYDGLFFGMPREDDQLTAILQLEFPNAFGRGIDVSPHIRYINNESDVDLYDYDRTELGVTIRWSPK